MKLETQSEEWGPIARGLQLRVNSVWSEYDPWWVHRIKICIRNMSSERIDLRTTSIINRLELKITTRDGLILTTWQNSLYTSFFIFYFSPEPCVPPRPGWKPEPTISLDPGQSQCVSVIAENMMRSWPHLKEELALLASEKTILVARWDGSIYSNELPLPPSGTHLPELLEEWTVPPPRLVIFGKLVPPSTPLAIGQLSAFTLIIKNVLDRPVQLPPSEVCRTRLWTTGRSPNGSQWNSGSPNDTTLAKRMIGLDWNVGDFGSSVLAPGERRQVEVWYTLHLQGKWELQCIFDTSPLGKSEAEFRGRVETEPVSVDVE